MVAKAHVIVFYSTKQNIIYTNSIPFTVLKKYQEKN